MREKESFHPHTSDVVLIHVEVKGDVFEFIGHGNTKNWTVLCDYHQDWFYFSAMYNNWTPHSNMMKKFQWEVIQVCTIFVGIFYWASGSFKGGWVVLREEGMMSWCLYPFIIYTADPC